MAEGHIKIDISVDGKQVDIASKDLDRLDSAGRRSGKGAKEAEQGMRGVSEESSKASGNVKKFAASLGLVAIGAMAFRTLKNSMDDAIKRFDTMNNFPKVLQALGVSAEDSERSINNLSDGIDGLPTKLDDIASTAQRMYTSFGDMDVATDSALALNNALLGSGSSAEQASRGTEMYLKALQTGQIDLMTWRSLSETMDVGLVKIAEGFDFAGRSAKDDLYNALKDGTITMDQFNDKLIEVGTGTGIMAKLARENSLGLATSWTNLRTAFARGATAVIESMNRMSKEVTGKELAQNIDSLKVIVFASFEAIAKAIDATTPVVKLFASGVSATIPVVKALSPAIIGLMVAYGAYTVITKASAAIQASNNALRAAMTVKAAATLATTSFTTAQVANTAATQADAIAKGLQTGAIKLSTVVIGLMTGQIKLATVATLANAAATTVLSNALKLLSGPVGWVTAGIGAVAAGAVAVVKWFKRSSKEADRLNKETEELSDATDELNASLEESAKAYKDNQTEVKASAKYNAELADKIDELANKENKSAGEKQLLNSYIEDLNESVHDLNLAYDEEADALSMSSEQLQARIDLFKEQETANEAMERSKELTKEIIDIEQQLEEVNELRNESNILHAEGELSRREHKKAVEELDEQEKELTKTLEGLSEQQAETEEQINETMEAMTEAIEGGTASEIIAIEDLSESKQATIESMQEAWEEYKDAATDMFDTLSDEAELTVDEMTKNLEENQRIIGEWAEGIAELAKRGVDEGLLDKLREAGPESAGHVNALVNASDEELSKLSDAFAKGGETATDALSKSLGIDKTNIMDAVGHLVKDTEQSLKDQVDSAGFDSIGSDVAQGLADGITDGAPTAEQASQHMAESVVDASADELGIQSPSTVFKGHGKDITEGLHLGISGGTAKVISTAKKLLKSTLDPFDGLTSQFSVIGIDAMAGLNAGLNAGRARVLNTARGIANDVTRTMQSALRIHSPSIVMRDEVGRWIHEGISVGIEEHAGLIDRVLNNMSQKMVKVSSPEIALGRSMGYAGGGHSVVNNNPVTENRYNTVDMDGLFSGAVFNVRDDQDIPRLAKEINDYTKNQARKHGVIMP